jgi:plastocyanin
MRKKIFVLVLILVIAAAILFLRSEDRPEIEPAATISITENGFIPYEVTIRKGDSVRFINDGEDGYVWPASDLHPTHELYPEFDPREPVGPGDSWTFTFERAGTWKMHDHLKSRSRGSIIVIE